MINNIEKGKQLGFEKRIFIEEKYLWYSFAIQKKENLYYVYESEIFEEKMIEEIYEYEKVTKYTSIDKIINNHTFKYELTFNDIGVLKGQKIFNIDFYD